MSSIKEILRETGLVVATNNSHKLVEFKRILTGIQIESLNDAGLKIDVEETGETFEQNAFLKASAVFHELNRPSISDDSGIVVDALNGEPGVHSARYGGEGLTDEQRTDLLLKKLEGVDRKNRTARFTCVLCVVYSLNSDPLYFSASVEGHIHTEKLGSNGFGYDPVFIEEGRQETFGQLPSNVKDENSHRAKALRKLMKFLNS